MVGASFTVTATGRTARTVTASNQAKISTAQTKFGGASAVFDGADDYITASTLSLSDLTGDFTIEAFFRFSTLPSSGNSGYMMFTSSSASSYIYIQNATMQIALPGDKYGSWTLPSISTNTWYHLAVVRSSGTIKVYWDGTERTSFTNDYNWTPSGTDYIVGATPKFGEFIDDRGSWNGYMDEIRISKSARYTANFTPTTSAFVNDANTLLLIHANGTDNSTAFTDDNGVRNQIGISAIGNAQVSTAQSKFGGASLLLDGTGDYLKANGFTSDFGTGDFTIETWVRFNSVSGVQVIVDRREIGPGNPNGLLIYYNGGFIYHGNLSTRISGGTASTGVWYHLTVARSSGSTKMFLDGTQIGSTYTDTLNYSVNQTNYIGESVSGGAGFNGYMDEIRFSNSARYTTTFTPSTTAFVNDADTILLMHANGTNGTTTFTDDNS
jgi:hypothetical protein